MFERLFEPITIGELEVKNRVIMAPMATHYATRDGHVTQLLIDHYAERAKAGVGMIVTESNYVHPEGMGGSNRLSICDDYCIPGLKRLTSEMHSHGARIAVQLHHGGRQVSPDAICQYPVSASSLPAAGWGVRSFPRALTTEEIHELVGSYSEAARRTMDAGCDAVQILAGHGYLLWSFLSPLGNMRTDAYGGSFQNRMRFLLEIIGDMKRKLGRFPTIVRINGSDYLPGGITVQEAAKIAKNLERAGVDAISVSAGTRESHEHQVPPRAFPEACNADLGAVVKREVEIPVSIAGRISLPETAEQILREKKADMVEIGRALLCDAHWVEKAAEGRQDDILPCVQCIRCDERLFSDLTVKCTLNAALGVEGACAIEPAKFSKNVVIVGGGPAGLEAARVAALRGHNVSLFEKDAQLGGQIRLAANAPYGQVFSRVISYFESQVKRLGVKVTLGFKVTPEDIRKMTPDVVIMATGSIPFVPDVEGIEGKNVVTAHDVLGGRTETGRDVVILGSGYVAFETADLLAEQGKRVTMIARKKIRMNIENSNGKVLLQRVSERGTKILIDTIVVAIERNGVMVNRCGRTQLIKTDTVVVSLGTRPNSELGEKLEDGFKEVHAIGSCVEPGEAFQAIAQGYMIGRKI